MPSQADQWHGLLRSERVRSVLRHAAELGPGPGASRRSLVERVGGDHKLLRKLEAEGMLLATSPGHRATAREWAVFLDTVRSLPLKDILLDEFSNPLKRDILAATAESLTVEQSSFADFWPAPNVSRAVGDLRRVRLVTQLQTGRSKQVRLEHAHRAEVVTVLQFVDALAAAWHQQQHDLLVAHIERRSRPDEGGLADLDPALAGLAPNLETLGFYDHLPRMVTPAMSN